MLLVNLENAHPEFRWWDDQDLSEDILRGELSTIWNYMTGLEDQYYPIETVEKIHPSCRRVSRFRRRPISTDQDVKDVLFDLRSYCNVDLNETELRKYIANIMALETMYYFYAENVAKRKSFMLYSDKSELAEILKNDISWMVWGRWDTTFGECFTGLHRLIVSHLADPTHWNENESLRAYKRVCYGLDPPTSSKFLFTPQDQERKKKAHIRISRTLEKIPLPQIASGFQRLSWFEQMCGFIAMGYTSDFNSLQSFADFWGIQRKAPASGVDRVIDYFLNKGNDHNLGESVLWQQINSARCNSIYFLPSGKLVSYNNPRLKLIGKQPIQGLSYEQAQVWLLAIEKTGHTLSYTGKQIGKQIGRSNSWTCEQIRVMAELL